MNDDYAKLVYAGMIVGIRDALETLKSKNAIDIKIEFPDEIEVNGERYVFKKETIKKQK